MAQSTISRLASAAYNNPENTATIAGDTGALASSLASGADTALGGFGSLAGGAGNLASGISSMRQGNYAAGAGDLAAGAASAASLVPSLLEHTPVLGAVGGLAQTAGHATAAYQNSQHVDAAYSGNPFWSEVGSTALAGAGTAAALDPTGFSSTAVAGGTAALNGLGMLSSSVLGEDYGFSAASAVGAASHAAYDTTRNVARAGRWGLGMLGSGASMLYNSLPSMEDIVGG